MAVNLLGTWHVLTAAADDISSASRTSREMAQSLHPDVEWRGGQEYDQQPYKALINNEVLNWMPRYKWRPQDTNTMSL
jgi:UDP-glucose 4-epimerase